VTDLSQYLDGELTEYVLCQPDREQNRLETCVIWHVPTGGVLTMLDDELHRQLKRWMLEMGVPIVDRPPLDADRKPIAVDPQLVQDFEAQGGSLARNVLPKRPGRLDS